MSGIATSVANAIVNAEVRNTAYTGPAALWLSCHTADPGATGASEVTGGSYARQPIVFAAPSGGTSLNNATINFTGMPAATVSHIGLWDAVSAGNFLQSGQLTGPIVVGAGNTLQFTAGQVSFNVSAI